MAPAVFNTDVAEHLGQAGSIPVRLRHPGRARPVRVVPGRRVGWTPGPDRCHRDRMDGLTALDAAGIAERVHDGWTSAVDVARAHLDRIVELDDDVGAFAVVDPRRVLAEAGAVDTRADRFALPLAGVPVAVEDRIDVAGHPTRHGSAATPDEPARRDDALVKRLRAAGALIIGKTRVPELAAWGAGATVTGWTASPPSAPRRSRRACTRGGRAPSRSVERPTSGSCPG